MSTNDITGASIRSRPPSKVYDEQWERIYGQPKEETKADGEEPSGSSSSPEEISGGLTEGNEKAHTNSGST